MRALAIIGCGLFWAGLAAAQPVAVAPPAPNQSVNAEAMAAALDLVDQNDVEKQMMATGMLVADAAMKSQLEAFRKQGIDLPAELVVQLRKLVLDDSTAMIGELAKTVRADTALVYARYFTAAELRELKVLQSHPVMRKVQALTPQMAVELSKIGMDKAAERQPDMQRKIQALVEKWMAEQKAGNRPTS